MTTKTSKAQLEVWEWKEKIYEQGKNLLPAERIELMKQQTQSLLAYLKQKATIKVTRKKL